MISRNWDAAQQARTLGIVTDEGSDIAGYPVEDVSVPIGVRADAFDGGEREAIYMPFTPTSHHLISAPVSMHYYS